MRTGYHFRRVYIWVALQPLQIRRIFFYYKRSRKFPTDMGHFFITSYCSYKSRTNFTYLWRCLLHRILIEPDRTPCIFKLDFLYETFTRKKDIEKENIHSEFQFIPTNAAWYTLLRTETRDICLILLLFRQRCEINYPYILRSKSITVKPWIRYKTVYRD